MDFGFDFELILSWVWDGFSNGVWVDFKLFCVDFELFLV